MTEHRPFSLQDHVAGIVLFGPDPAHLRAVVSMLLEEVGLVLLYLNSPTTPELDTALAPFREGGRLRLLGDGDNRGLATAYNGMAAIAAGYGARTLLLLDQDSLPPPGMVEGLADATSRLRKAGYRIAVVGPTIQHLDGTPQSPPPGRPVSGGAPVGLTPVDAVISSGSLISLESLREIGPFREDFFIDMVDTEWSLRGWARGCGSWIAESVSMRHALGKGTLSSFGVTIVLHEPARIYTALRNETAMLWLGHVPWRRRLSFVLSLAPRSLALLRHAPNGRAMLRAIRLGLIDGALRRLGDPRPRWRTLQRDS